STTGRSGERSRRPLRATRSDQNQTASAATASSSGLVLPQATRVGPAAGMRTGRDPEKTSSCTPPRYTHDHPNFGQQQGPRANPFRSLERPRSITAVFVSSVSLATGFWPPFSCHSPLFSPTMRPPSYRQRLFVEHDLGEPSGSAVDAARRAGYSTPHPAGVNMRRNATFKAHFRAFYPHPANKSALRAESGRGQPVSGAREAWLAANVPLATVLPPHASRPTPHAPRRQTSGVRCAQALPRWLLP